MKRPSNDELYLAAMWLDSNEGYTGEREACARVALWLEEYAAAAEERAAARKVGVSIAHLRRMVKGS